MIDMTARETDTVIAALRWFQEQTQEGDREGYVLGIAGEHGAPLDDTEIDILIESKINVEVCTNCPTHCHADGEKYDAVGACSCVPQRRGALCPDCDGLVPA